MLKSPYRIYGARGEPPHHVAKKKPNAYGLYDMLGNVVEFTADWFVIAGYDSAAATDPATPSPVHPNGGHALRGGHWAYPGGEVRVSTRLFGSDDGAIVAGFRCALALQIR